MLMDAAVIFVVDDTHRTGREAPMMLERVQGVPLLSWLAASLSHSGVRRFFLVAQPGWITRAKACFPVELDLTVCTEQDPADLLHVFLSTMEEEARRVMVLTGPVVYLPIPASRPAPAPIRKTAAFAADRECLMEALDQAFSFAQFLGDNGKPCGQEDGFYSVSDYVELLNLQNAMNRCELLRLARSGVRIWDMDGCHVTPWTTAEAGTELLPGTVLAGRNSIGAGCSLGPNTYLTDCSVADGACIVQSRCEKVAIGPDCAVGPFANLRPGTSLGPAASAGAFVELERTHLGARSQVISHAYLGDSSLGQDCTVGSGVVTANYDGLDKCETRVADAAFVGTNASLVGPLQVGQGAYVGAGSVVTQDVPAGALALGRSRQSNKKDWANKK